jgi:hypothetical protein
MPGPGCGVYLGWLWVFGPVHCRVQFSLICSLLLFARKEEKKGEVARDFSKGRHVLNILKILLNQSRHKNLYSIIYPLLFCGR